MLDCMEFVTHKLLLGFNCYVTHKYDMVFVSMSAHNTWVVFTFGLDRVDDMGGKEYLSRIPGMVFVEHMTHKAVMGNVLSLAHKTMRGFINHTARKLD